jgi:branched-chain amino acid transport system ATP-binding protein
MLELEDIHSGYGGVPVLFGMTLSVKRGEVVALMGRNGMGKTTTIRTIFGVLRPSRGKISFAGQSLIGAAIHRIARRGLGLVPEGRAIFVNLTVRENLMATAVPRKMGWTLERVYNLFPRLAERAGNLGSQLSGGEQQMLAIGRALMTNPDLLVLDEATEGLAPVIRSQIWQALATLKQEGQSILIVDKYLGALSQLADRFFVVEKGRAAWTGTSEQIRAQRHEVSQYLSV